MGAPLVAVENFFSAQQFPDHAVSANEEATGREAFRVATGRRSPGDSWTTITANNPAYLQVTCDRPRAANFVALDAGHNLAGITVSLLGSNDVFATSTTVLSLTLPSTSMPGAIDDGLGVVTEGGCWLKRFPLEGYHAWRWSIAAMGAGLKPVIVGLWLGLALELEYFDHPYDDDGDDLLAATVETVLGRVATGTVARRRSGTMAIKLHSAAAYDQARYHLHGHFGERRPMWLVHDLEQAERAVLVARPANHQGLVLDGGWGYRQGRLAYQEWEPRLP